MFPSQALRLRALQRAAELCGSASALADYLAITPTKVEMMLKGLASVPDETFLNVVDLLMARDLASFAKREGMGDKDVESA